MCDGGQQAEDGKEQHVHWRMGSVRYSSKCCWNEWQVWSESASEFNGM